MVNERLTLRVDKNEAQEYNGDLHKLMRELGDPTPYWEWNPTLIAFIVWHGKIGEGCGLVEQLWNGSQLIVRYHPNQSTTRDIYFDISANKAVIPASLDIDMSKCGTQSTLELPQS